MFTILFNFGFLLYSTRMSFDLPTDKHSQMNSSTSTDSNRGGRFGLSTYPMYLRLEELRDTKRPHHFLYFLKKSPNS